MGNRLAGKVAIITGSARGMGEAEARLFVQEGGKVVVADVLEDLGSSLADELGADALFVRHDVTSEDDWSDLVATTIEHFGSPSVLVNNAGIVRYATIDQMPRQVMEDVFAVNVLGPWLGTKAVFEPMRRAGGGSIIHIGSTNSVRGTPGGSAYTTSKHALAGLTKSNSVELGPFGIRVNMIMPGGVATPMSSNSRSAWYGESVLESRPSDWSLPLGRWGAPSDIAAMALFLASDEASYSTGAEFVVDGGMLADHPFRPAQGWVNHREKLLAELRD